MKVQKENKETLAQKTGNNVSTQSVRLAEIDPPTCDILLETKGTINDHSRLEAFVCILEPITDSDSSSSQDPLSGLIFIANALIQSRSQEM